MTDSAPDTSTKAVERLADKLMAEPDHHYQGYGQSAAFKLRALVAERDRALEWRDHDRERALAAEARAEAAEAEVARLRGKIERALIRLDASLFTNAEHQQAKDILRGALEDKT